jgi:hypothetical protein
MEQIIITCPECKHEFTPDQSLKGHLDHLMQDERLKLQGEYDKIHQLKKQLSEKETSITELVNEAVEKEKLKIKADLEKKVRDESDVEIKELKELLNIQQQKINKAKQLEIQIEAMKREAKEREDDMRLQYDKQKAVDQAKFEQLVVTRESERNQMKMAEKEKQLSDLRKQLEEARRKAEQGSMQTQGEVQELALQELLEDIFKFDIIRDVKKGANGADIIQEVKTPYGKACGIIALESKRAKNFSDSWIAKLKEDMRTHGATHGIIVTEVMPKDMPTFGLRDGIWICTFKEIAGLVAAIRQICITETSIKATEKDKESKVHALYNYLMSREFKQRVEGILQHVSTMKENVEKHRKSVLSVCRKQEIEIDQMNFLMIDIIGSIDGLSGNALGQVRGLELDQGSEAA